MTPEPDDLEAIREAVRRVCRDFPDAYWREKDAEHEFPWGFAEAMAAGGWVGVAIPEEYGGGGRGITEASVVVEEIAASGAALNGASAIHLQMFGMNPVVRHGSPEMRASYLPAVAAGELHVVFGVTEPDAGSRHVGHHHSGDEGWRPIHRARSKGLDHQGAVLPEGAPPGPHHFLDEVARRTDRLTLLLADLQRPEVTITQIPKVGRNAVVSCEVVYDDLPVPVTDRVGEEGAGFDTCSMGSTRNGSSWRPRRSESARWRCAARWEYATDRVVFGRPIGKNQGIAFPLAEAHMRLKGRGACGPGGIAAVRPRAAVW